MFNFFKFLCSKSESKPEKKFPVPDDLPKSVYQAIDWSQCVIGGSYALKQFTGDTWNPEDVDIFGIYQNKEDFNQKCLDFQKRANLELVKENWAKDLYGAKTVRKHDITQEDFDITIMGTKTYQSQEFDKKIQMIGIDQDLMKKYIPNARNVSEALASMTDVPACINYYLNNGQKMFNVPEKGIECLFTQSASVVNICAKRREKYEGRGYRFKPY